MLCRLVKPLGKTFMTHGSSSFQVPANILRNVTLTLHKVHTLHTNRALCRTALTGHVTNVNDAKGQENDIYLTQKRDTSCGFTSDWQHWDRIATIATCLSSVQSRGGRGHILTPQSSSDHGLHVTRNRLESNVFIPGPFIRHCSFETMQTRASSTAAAAKHREASEEQPSVSHKEEEQTLKDPSPPPDNPEPAPEGGKPNKTQQLKKVFKEYGAVGVSFHICMSLMSLGMFYLLVSSGIDMAALLCKMGFSETVVKSKMAAGTSTFVLAYAIHKLFAPVRISITLVSVPLIVRHFRKIGLFKASPTAPQ
ncbi:protein FAM210B, mitochondrial [Periophthalmus magnuspinnatus]|uniref:protein FAM210B, mitochondrial n=1 Tax=Periophthalmus magnuspinnatus TaxID=409849 RepID=UPI00145B3C74|nr:protein FAM210B, mitochondrial [Periophthalmus magnuspinnatus]